MKFPWTLLVLWQVKIIPYLVWLPWQNIANSIEPKKVFSAILSPVPRFNVQSSLTLSMEEQTKSAEPLERVNREKKNQLLNFFSNANDFDLSNFETLYNFTTFSVSNTQHYQCLLQSFFVCFCTFIYWYSEWTSQKKRRKDEQKDKRKKTISMDPVT